MSHAPGAGVYEFANLQKNMLSQLQIDHKLDTLTGLVTASHLTHNSIKLNNSFGIQRS
jgi:hypothetical protein